jgi:four helix bundle protein
MQLANAVTVDPHRLDVYAVALAFHQQMTGLTLGRGQAAVRDQLTRASLSIVLNVAEGAGRFSPGDKARFYGMARGSACECAAILDVLALQVPCADSADARALLARIVRMLTRLVARMKERR